MAKGTLSADVVLAVNAHTAVKAISGSGCVTADEGVAKVASTMDEDVAVGVPTGVMWQRHRVHGSQGRGRWRAVV